MFRLTIVDESGSRTLEGLAILQHFEYERTHQPFEEAEWAEIANGPCGLRCDCCMLPYAEYQRQNTMYHDEVRNYVTLCPICAAENEAYWADRWAEYYASLS